MLAIDARHIRHSYVFSNKHVRSLVDVSLQVGRGEFVAIVGRNGCGKSTFAKHLNALLELQHGSLTVAQLDASDQSLRWELRRHCGMVFQNPDNQFVSSVVREDLLFGLRNFDIPQGEREGLIARALETVQMTGFEAFNPHQLSGGQKQRVALAGVLALEPDIVVLDEATTMLPPYARREVLDVVRRMRDTAGITAVMITHYIEEAVSADRVFVMDEGSVVADGSPHEVLADVEVLDAAGLEPPFAVRLWADLRGKGYVEETPCPLTLEEAARLLGERLVGVVSGTAPACSDGAQPPKDREALVELDAVSFSYDADHPAVLDSVSLGIAAGEFVGVVGRTGCGKSTLVQLIAGLLEPSRGTIRLDGDDINASGYDRIRLRRRVGMVFQYPEMQLFEQTVRKDVAFGFKQLGLQQSECDERVRWALRAVGFDPDDVLEKSPLGLSGGEKRRVAIAGVLAVRPEVLILDEPVAGLDPKGRAEFMQLLSRLNADGTTIIMVSHNADCLAEFANRIVVMDAGRIVRDASPQEAYADVEMLHALGIGASQARELAWLLAEEGVNVGAPASYPELFERLTALFAG